MFDVLAETPVLTLFLVVAVRHARRTDPIRSDPLWVRLALRFLVGLITLPIGPVSLSLAVTAGPLLVGIALGWLERTGPIVWSLPTGASLTSGRLGCSCSSRRWACPPDPPWRGP